MPSACSWQVCFCVDAAFTRCHYAALRSVSPFPLHQPTFRLCVCVCVSRLAAGYGAAFSGVAPMLAALNSSAPGVTVVNIDSGFGASMAAWRILKNASRIRQAAMGK